MARPLLNIDAEQVEKLASIGCTNQEIASFFNCSKDTIEGRFSAELHKGRDTGKMRLRKLQLNAAEKGNVVMLIWLGKQMLGQSDKIVHAEDKSLSSAPDVSNLTEEEKQTLLKVLVKNDGETKT